MACWWGGFGRGGFGGHAACSLCDAVEHAFKPPQVHDETEGFSKIRSYVYVIRKKFNPYQLENTPQEKAKKLHTKLNLFKIGMSSFGTRDGEDKGGLPRLSGLRTSLINFDVFRIYIYGPFIGDGQCQKPISIYTAHGEYGRIISANSLTQPLWAIWGNILRAAGLGGINIITNSLTQLSKNKKN